MVDKNAIFSTLPAREPKPAPTLVCGCARMEGNPRKRPALEVGGLCVECTRTREEGFSRERVMSSRSPGKPW